jgi:pyruvate dehydrogenase (quinone)
MSETCGDFLVNRLHEWGVRRVYGYPGDGINGILGALNRGKDKLTFIQTRHEELAAFMACAHAKFTGEVGVCMATSGPGAVHLLNGLYDAKMDHMPVVAIVGQQATTALGGEYQQEIDLISLYKDVAHEYVHMATTPLNVRTQIDMAFRIAIARRTVTCVIIPNDVQSEPMQSPPRKHGTVVTGVGYTAPKIVPKPEDLRRAADLLNAGKKIAILIGAGALGAADEVRQVADQLDAGVAKALLGKAALDDDLPYCTGPIGLLGSKPSWEMMIECDTFFMIGSGFPYSEFLPKEGQARGVQIDIEPRMLSLRYPMEVPLHGDTRLTLQALLPLLEKADRSAWRKRIESNVEHWWKLLEDRAQQSADPINPQLVFWEVSKRLPDNAIIAADSGSSANWFARDLKVRTTMMASLSGNLATMCPGVPYVAAAKHCFPDRPAIGFVGDGAMQMLGNNGLIDIGRDWKNWSDPRCIVVVLNNQDLNQVTWEQRVLEGDPKFTVSQAVPEFNYAQYADSLGIKGVRVESPNQIGDSLDQAFAADRPCVVDVLTDPNVPTIPPHITFQQAKHYLTSMASGDPDAMGMVKQSFRDVFASWVPDGH